MVSPRITRHDYKTWLVALLCLTGVGAGAHFLYEDFHQSAGEGQGAPMAKVERREAKVRRKPSKSFAWTNAQADEKLFRRDSVQTSVGSAAAIRFNDGTLLELGENSLVVIEDIQHLSLDFLKGSVVLHTAEGDKRVTVGTDGKARFEELPVRLVKPEPLTRYFVAASQTKAVRFGWKIRTAVDPTQLAGLTLQISPDRSFREARVVTHRAHPVGNLETELPVGEGTYFWRLVAGDKPVTEVGQFRVIAATPLTPMSPVAGERLVSFGEASVAFGWLPPQTDDVPQGSHELQVARDTEFRLLSAKQEVAAASGQATLRGLAPGLHYWRIVSRYGDIQVPSRVERFEIAQAQRPALTLTLPEDGKALERAPAVRLSWSSDAQGLSYKLEVQGSQGRAVLPSTDLSSAGYLLKNLPPGAYRWRVSALHKGQAVAESMWRAFSVFEGAPIALRSPAQAQDIRYWETPPPIVYRWDADTTLERQPTASYRVQVSSDAEFKTPLEATAAREPQLDGARIALVPGSYFWRVQVVDEAGQVLKASVPGRFNYGPYPLLRAPELVAPAQSAVLNPLERESDATPVISWREVPEARAYDVTVYAAPSGRSVASPRVVFHSVVTDRTSVELKGLKPDRYTWSVSAIDPLKRKGQAAPPRPFELTYGDLLGAPQVVSPEVQ